MDQLERWSVKAAKRTIAPWFQGDEQRRFIPFSGAGVAVSEAEERAIAAAAEEALARQAERTNALYQTCILAMAGAPLVYAWLIAPSFHQARMGAVSVTSLALGTLALAVIAWRHERAQFTLRAAIALSLAGRSQV